MNMNLKYLVLVLLLGTACSKNYLNVNNSNPNQVTSIQTQLLLAGTLNTTASVVTTDYPFLGCYQGYWTITQGFSDITDYANYNFSTQFGQNIWTDIYGNLGNLAQITAAASADSTLILYGAMARILKAVNFQMLVDVYNDVPYRQASIPTNIYPKYDSAQSIYDDLFLTIDSAISMINGASPTVIQPSTSDDIMFGGNMTAWKQFANTLKLRMLLHEAGLTARATYIQNALSIIAAEGDGFLQSGENAWVNPGYSQNNSQQSPFFAAFGFNSTGGTSSNYISFKANIYTINFFNNTNDVRLGYDYAPLTGYGGTPPYLYVGAPFGTIGLPSPSSASSIGAFMPETSTSPAGPRVGLLQSDAQSCPILTATESFFLQAEAAERGWISADPQSLYQQAITESYSYLLVNNPDSAAAAYYGQAIPNVSWAASPNKLEAIIVQKWAALNGIDMLEVWSDFRRTAYPSDLPLSNSPNVVSKTPPVRLLYPQIEYQTNAANVNAEGTINQFTNKIFWMP
jgi:hypothetical protein